MRVGVRELRENLRSWLDRVRRGEEIVVTERGRPIARFLPLDGGQGRLEELVERGIVRPPRAPRRTRVDVAELPRMTPGWTLSDIVVEHRRLGR